jgi:hypothetical protein
LTVVLGFCFGCTDFGAAGRLCFEGIGVLRALGWSFGDMEVGVSGVGYRKGIAVWS